MQIEKVNKQSLKKAIDLLKHGGVVVFPTETAYGIGCDFTNKKAILKIFKTKERPKSKNLPVICATKKMALQFFKISKKEQELAKKYWPGPLSIIMSPLISPSFSLTSPSFPRRRESHKDSNPSIITSHSSQDPRLHGDDRGDVDDIKWVGMTIHSRHSREGGNPMNNVPVRVSSNKIAQALSRGLKKPITATSANIAGEESLYNSQDVYDIFKNKKYQPDLILDNGKLKKNKPSTIIAIEGDEIIVKRMGEIKITGKC